MRREGRVGGKPTNHSKKTGKCKVVGCEACHESLPVSKSRGKGKGRIKRLVSDIPSTHLLSDWRVTRKEWDGEEEQEEVDANYDDHGSGEPEGWALSISLLLDTALEHIQEAVEARKAVVAASAQEQDSDEEEDAEVPDLEAFKTEFEVFKSEIEAGARASPPSVAESMDSWSGIELSDADESSLGDDWEDDWSLVEDDIIVV